MEKNPNKPSVLSRISFKNTNKQQKTTKFNNNSLVKKILLTCENDNIKINKHPVPFRTNSKIIAKTENGIITAANWYRIYIPCGVKFEKKVLINSLLSCMSPSTFIPIMYTIIGHAVVFYVDNQEAASALLRCNKKISVQDGFIINVRVSPGYPQCTVDDTLKEKLKIALERRYVRETNALDLSEFHLDPELVDDYFCALFRHSMLASVLEMVAEVVPNLEALNLENNKMMVTDKLGLLSSMFPNLKILHIGNNKIRQIEQINVLTDLKLEELRLEGNPVCKMYRNREEEYISEVRKRCRHLIRLDGQDLPKMIGFDLDDESVEMPSNIRVYFSHKEAHELSQAFLQQYFQIYDSESRHSLLAAYHEQATFSLTVDPCLSINKFAEYRLINRNFLKIKGNEKEKKTKLKKLLKEGKLPVVSAISELPKTQHHLDSFTMDIAVLSNSLMMIILTGMFNETEYKDKQTIFFNRTFIITPEGSGFVIKNEQLHIFNPSSL